MKRMFFFGLILGLLEISSWAANIQPLPAEQAFVFSAKITDRNQIQLHWDIAPQHYLYQEKFSFKIIEPKGASIGHFTLPPGQAEYDKLLGNYPIYSQQLIVSLPIVDNSSNQKVVLKVGYQGCSHEGYCYPPITHNVTADFSHNTVQIGNATTSDLVAKGSVSHIIQLLVGKNLITIIISFLGLGLLLSFTPCVLPMIPILSGIILGHGHHISTGKAFRLSLTYVLSMSFTYAIAGLLVGYLGASLQIFFQKPWVLALFSAIFVLLALSLFGAFQIKPPQRLEAFLAKISHHQKKGSYTGVAVMGCLGTLIISPCVTPPLVGALSYISSTGNALVGAAALFSTGFGMGIPLLLIGTGGKFLPKTGHWMQTVKIFLGVMMLAVAILLLQRILPGQISLLLWAALSIGCGIYAGALNGNRKSKWYKAWKSIGIVLLIYGVLMVIGAALGNDDPFNPFAHQIRGLENKANLEMLPIKNLQSLNQALAQASSENKPVMLDFYADWCVACHEMDDTTFSDHQVIAALKNIVILRANVTDNDFENRALMQKYQVIAPPTILFFYKGQELKDQRVIGKATPEEFLQTLQQINSPP
jgi:thiol:disulfide interchange protein DsbD